MGRYNSQLYSEAQFVPLGPHILKQLSEIKVDFILILSQKVNSYTFISQQSTSTIILIFFPIFNWSLLTLNSTY